MNARRFSAMLLVGLQLAVVLVTVTAQEDDAPLLTLTSPDPAHPVQFQVIAPGETPTTAGFTSRLDIPADADPDTHIIYVTIQNTGWSEGVIGLISERLSPDDRYVALEVDADGAPIDGGLVFELTYDADLEGFVLPVLIAQVRALAVFRVVDDGGMAFAGQTNVRNGDLVVQNVFETVVDPEPVFAPFVLECHIVARPIPPAEPEVTAEPGAPGTWGACGSCNTCGHVGECLLSPEGRCVWDPGTCRVDLGTGSGGGGDSGGGSGGGDGGGPGGGGDNDDGNGGGTGPGGGGIDDGDVGG
jgi:hypothetical protein